MASYSKINIKKGCPFNERLQCFGKLHLPITTRTSLKCKSRDQWRKLKIIYRHLHYDVLNVCVCVRMPEEAHCLYVDIEWQHWITDVHSKSMKTVDCLLNASVPLKHSTLLYLGRCLRDFSLTHTTAPACSLHCYNNLNLSLKLSVRAHRWVRVSRTPRTTKRCSQTKSFIKQNLEP